jgi:hypothetical protein
MISESTRAAVRRVLSRTLRSGSFTVLTKTEVETDFGTQEEWDADEDAVSFKGRLSKEMSDAKTVLDVAKPRDRFTLTTPSVIELEIGSKVRRTGGFDYVVIGVEHGPSFGPRVASAYRVAEVKP